MRGRRDEIAIESPILFERKLAVVLPEKTEKALVVTRFHVEQAQDDAIVATSFFQPFTHEIAYLVSRDFAAHVERVDRRPERLPVINQFPKEVIGNCQVSLSRRLRAARHVLPDFSRERVQLHKLASAGHDKTLDDVFN